MQVAVRCIVSMKCVPVVGCVDVVVVVCFFRVVEVVVVVVVVVACCV